MENEKIPKQKPHTSFNRRQSVAKNPEGEHDNGQEKYLIFYFTGGNMTKGGGNMAKGITVFNIYNLLPICYYIF